MPEIDLPGHTQAAISAYPELGNVPSRQHETRTTWGISSHILNLSDTTISFVLDVLDEVVDVFPFEFVHIGGDEVPVEEWRASADELARAAALGLDDVRELQGWFAGRLAEHLAARGARWASGTSSSTARRRPAPRSSRGRRSAGYGSRWTPATR
ncbi:hypothetical protein Pflav_003380 [Phytohabitans flavus]|uniref:beta-N-acetylhexosaminidase n=1 Tax=Phytohabitans flavus TaxID=1076124 RepID=A0A6F8XJF5_9ACTN|nr:hypothetical protein Pflav_003380 [Phytohabitans flavus]